MATPDFSDLTTHGIRVRATAYYLPEKSDPSERRYVFGYTIVLTNDGDTAAQLLGRRWLIIDSAGRREDVEGAGVVGQTPRIEPGHSFKYQSYCPLRTPWGTMEGNYQFRRADGTNIEVPIGRFYLHLPQPEPVGSR
jgi:ApaG protein